jgi:hypothetical protein
MLNNDYETEARQTSTLKYHETKKILRVLFKKKEFVQKRVE